MKPQWAFCKLAVALAGIMAFSLLHAVRAQADSWTVTNLADSGQGSLRTIIASASPGDLVHFGITGTITNLSGELLIDKNLHLIGPGPKSLAISGNNSARVFRIESFASVAITGLAICDGRARDGANGTDSLTPGGLGEDGGGIHNSGTLTLTNCLITLCRSGAGGRGFNNPIFPSSGGPSNGGMGGNGGGIYNSGSLIMVGCSINRNTNGNGGGGGLPRWSAYSSGAGANGGNGGAIYNLGTAMLLGCTISSNSAGIGGAGAIGGVSNDLTGLTDLNGGGGGSSGAGGAGGGIYSQGELTLISCTLSANSAGDGGTGGAGGQGSVGSRVGGTGGTGGTGAEGGTGGSGGGVYCLGAFEATACTIAGNAGGRGGKGGNGGTGAGAGRPGGPVPYTPGGNGGSGANGGVGGSGGGTISIGGTPRLRNVLIAQNLAGAGGLGGSGGAGGTGTPNGYAGYPGSSGLPGLGPDVSGACDSQGRNFVGHGQDASGFSDVLGDIIGSTSPLDPLLGPLADNGGPTFTRALLQSSPALDAGDDALLSSPLNLLTDQRGFVRKNGQHVDIGAYELQWAAGPIRLAASRTPNEPNIVLTVTNVPGACLNLLCATNPHQPMAAWTNLGALQETVPGQFQFTAPSPTGSEQRFYRVCCP